MHDAFGEHTPLTVTAMITGARKIDERSLKKVVKALFHVDTVYDKVSAETVTANCPNKRSCNYK